MDKIVPTYAGESKSEVKQIDAKDFGLTEKEQNIIQHKGMIIVSSSSYKPVDMFEKIVMTNVVLGVRSNLGAV
ncbi:hypothetical protein AAES_158510 [Amazona aestiva]|uniref:Uncharacterized protein n=1 Tax=Amazona aestiva TaxID=12930 RepID=A0A0Q3UQ00_AMAAE|nr:hypothetical protein AAES_158510 [Amazona aestiva]